VHLLDNGTYQLALVSLSGFDQVEAVDATGLHPAAKASTVLNALGSTAPAAQPTLYATLLLWKKSGTTFTDAELLPVRQVRPTAGGATVVLATGGRKELKYKE
jgi:hypothetical protein